MSDANTYDQKLACIEPADRAAASWASATLAELAAILGGPDAADAADAGITFPVRRLKPGETLCRAGDPFAALYVVRSGFLKVVSVDPTGNEQVLAFPMRGDVIGLGSLEPGHHTADAIALDAATWSSSRSSGSPASAGAFPASSASCIPSSAASSLESRR